MSDYQTLHQRFISLEPSLGIQDKRTRYTELEQQTQASNLWDDQETAVKLLSEFTELQTLLNKWDELSEFFSMGEGISESDLETLEKEVVILELSSLLSGETDRSSALITIHAGTGGVDAQDFAEMLERMYLRYIEQGKTEQPEDRALSIDRRNWKAEILEINKGEEAGIKKVVIEVQGTYAYGLLKSEVGVHRLVRLSPFNAKNLRQTSFALIEVIPEVDQSTKVAINESDLRVDVYRSGGHGGQGVNTTDSAVRLTHLPTGLVVAVQNERSQHQNKATAMKILLSKLVRLQELKNAEETAMLKGEFKEGSWGNQIRSYVMQPYQMVKDHRTGCETSNIQAVLDGELKEFIESYLKTTTSN